MSLGWAVAWPTPRCQVGVRRRGGGRKDDFQVLLLFVDLKYRLLFADCELRSRNHGYLAGAGPWATASPMARTARAG